MQGSYQSVKGQKFLVYIVGITAALAGLLFGLDTGVINGAKIYLVKEFHATVGQEEIVVSAILYGAVIGTIVSGFISRYFGRRFAILASAAIFTVGSILSAASVSIDMLIGMRFLLGIALGIASFTAPVYLSEVSPKKVRGGLIALYQLMITIGLLCAFLSDSILSYFTDWRWMLGVVAIPAFIMFLAVLALPKSPRWLMLRGNKQAAKDVLDKVRHSHEIDEELAEIEYSLGHQKLHPLQLLRNKFFLRVLGLGIVLQLIQQFSGINTIIYYSTNIFKMAGFTTHAEQLWATVIVGLVNVLTTVLSVFIVDKLGRRPILFVGLTFTTLSMLALGIMFHVGIHTEALRILAVIFVLTFIFGFAVSLGTIIWILCAEIFPLQGRDFGVTCTTASNWIGNAIVSSTFLTLIGTLGTANTFWVFAGLGLLSFFFVMKFAPETKGISLEHIEANLMDGKSCRLLGR